MKLAILADIHGNYAALEIIAEHIDRWHPDGVIVAGDIVNRGPRSLECWRFVQNRQQTSGWKVISGNHDLYVLHQARDNRKQTGAQEAVRQNALWTRQQLGEAVWELADLPEQISLAGIAGEEVRIVHASMRSNRDNIFIDTPDAELREKIAPAPAVFGCGHTHKPLVRRIDATLVINVGSVGMPFAGDLRACYAQIMWDGTAWQAELIRLEYDRERTRRDFQESGFLDQSGPTARLLFDEFLTARPRLNRWLTTYVGPIDAGELSVEESILRYMAQESHP